MGAMDPPAACKVYTPLPLAIAMVDAIRIGDAQKWLEPSFGKGAFFAALKDRGIARANVLGIDLDRRPEKFDSLGVALRGKDFLQWAPEHNEAFDCVIGNPPYVAISALRARLRETASSVLDFDGHPIGSSANTWYAFLVNAIKLLCKGGSLALILPSSCEYANYCSSVRTTIVKMFDRVDLIRCRRPLFEEVQEGTVVLVCKGKGGEGHSFRRHELDTLDAVIRRLRELPTLTARQCPRAKVDQKQLGIEFGKVMQVGLGGVTGDADYFAISESRRRDLDIPLRAVKPVVTRARQIRSAEIDLELFEALRDADERVWLFDPPKTLLRHPSVRRYLQLSEEDGGCHRQRYKVSIRHPWYHTRLPHTPDAFLSGMSSDGLWLSFNETPKLNATNTLYVVHFKSQEYKNAGTSGHCRC
jgi:adenine-specific DNA-methyltransferase